MQPSADSAHTPILTVEVVAELFRCSEATVRDRALEFGGLKFGRDWIFPAETFYAVLNELAQESVAAHKGPPAKPNAVLKAVPKRAPPALPST